MGLKIQIELNCDKYGFVGEIKTESLSVDVIDCGRCGCQTTAIEVDCPKCYKTYYMREHPDYHKKYSGTDWEHIIDWKKAEVK